MITRLMFRLTVFTLILTALSISAVNWIGARTPAVSYVYSYPTDDAALLRLGDTHHGWQMPLVHHYSTDYFWSPDGESLFYVHRLPDLSFRWCRWRTGGTTFCSDIASNGVRSVSPDNRYFIKLLGQHINRWDLQTDALHLVQVEGMYVTSYRNELLDWLPDNAHVILADDRQLTQINIHTGERQIIHEEDEPLQWVDVSPLHPVVAYATRTRIVLFDVVQREVLQLLTFEAQFGAYNRWAPDGERFLASEEVLSTHGVSRFSLEPGSKIITWADDSRHVYYACPHEIRGYNLCRLDTQTGEALTVAVLQQSIYVQRDGTALIAPPATKEIHSLLLINGDVIRFVPLDLGLYAEVKIRP